MGTTLNRHAYQRMIDEDLEWLMKQPRTLEREHIATIVRQSPDREYTRTTPNAAEGDAVSRANVVKECERFIDAVKGRQDDRADGAFVAMTRLARNLGSLPALPKVDAEATCDTTGLYGVGGEVWTFIDAMQSNLQMAEQWNMAKRSQELKDKIAIHDAEVERIAKEINAECLIEATIPSPAAAREAAEDEIDAVANAIMDEMECVNVEQGNFAGPIPREQYLPNMRRFARAALNARHCSVTPVPAQVDARTFVETAFGYLNTISGADVCSDRSCIRCRIADAAFEVERGIAAPAAGCR